MSTTKSSCPRRTARFVAVAALISAFASPWASGVAAAAPDGAGEEAPSYQRDPNVAPSPSAPADGGSRMTSVPGGSGYGDDSYQAYEMDYLPDDQVSPKIGRLVGYDTSVGKHWSCAGTVIARDLVLTAGHCVIGTDGEYLQGLTFSPGQTMSGSPYGTWDAAAPHVYRSFAESPRAWGVDYAVVELDTDERGRHIGDVVGTVPVAFNQPIGADVISIGYPGEGSYFSKGCSSAGCSQYYCYAPIEGAQTLASGTVFGFGCDATGGQSGGPILQSVNGRISIVSVNSNGTTAETEPDGETRRFLSSLWGPQFGAAAQRLIEGYM
jgi:protease YdgD